MTTEVIGSLTDRIRALLKDVGEPVSITTMVDVLDLDQTSKQQTQKNLYNMRVRGEIETSLIEGKTHYQYVHGFEPGRGGRGKKCDANVQVSPPPAAAEPVAEESSEPAPSVGEVAEAVMSTPFQSALGAAATEILETMKPGGLFGTR